jgi:hypothetical protein
MSILNVADVTRIAATAVQRHSSSAHVVGVTLNAGGSEYVEIVLEIDEQPRGPSQVVLGVFRDVTETALEAQIVGELQRQLGERRLGDTTGPVE